MQFWKKRLQRVAAMVCSVALVASMMPTAAFATEPEPTPTPEPTPVVETAPTPEPSESPVSTDAAVTTPAPGTDADSTTAPSEEPTETPDGSPAPSEEPVESPEPSEGPADGTPAPSEKPVESPEPSEVPAEQVQSVPQTLAAAPAADGEPETRSGPDGTNSELGNEYITVYYNHSATAADNRTLTVKVQDETGTPLCDDLTIGNVTLTTMTRVTLDQSKYAAYKIQSCELNGGGGITQIPGSLNNDQNKTFTLNAITNNSVLVVTLQQIQNDIIDLTDSKAGGKSFGSILYKEDESVSQTTNVHIYLNNEFVKTVKDLKLPSDVAGAAAGNDDSFVLTLNDGYYFAPYDVDGTVEVCTASTVSSEQHITWCKDTRNGLYSYLNYSLPDEDGTNDITLNFFTYEEGVRADFTRYVNGDTVYASGGGVSAACEDLNIRFTYNGINYTVVYDTWGQAQTIFLPRGTYIYVAPAIKDGFSFVYWLSEDSWTKGNSLYSVLPDGSLEQEETGLADEQKGLVALTQTMALYYDADGYTRAQIGLHMTDGDAPLLYNEVYYNSNYPVETGKENETETAYYYPTLDYGTRIENCMFSVEGYTFAGWNTQEDGKGTPYTAGQYFHDKNGNDLTLYAQWEKIETPPEDDKPDAPDGKTLRDLGLGVRVQCITKPDEHGNVVSTIRNTSVKFGDVVEKDGHYECVATISAAEYIERFNDATYGTPGHTGKDTEVQVVLTSDGKGHDWELAADQDEIIAKLEKPTAGGLVNQVVTFEVTCEEETTEPDDPTAEDIRELGAKIKVYCDTPNSGHENKVWEEGLRGDAPKDFEIKHDALSNTATVTIKNTDVYVKVYNEKVAPGHVYQKDGSDLSFKLKYDKDAWVLDPEDSTATILVSCPKATVKKAITSVERDGKPLDPVPEMLKVGDKINYQIEITNDSNITLEDLTVTDTFTGEGGFTFGSVGTGSVKMNDEGFVWSLDIAPKDSEVLNYSYTVVDADKGNTITNTATVAGAGLPDEPGDKTETKVENPAVGVEKSLVQVKRGEEIFLAYKGTIPEQLEVGDELTYEIEVKNIGNVKLNGLTLTDTFNGHFAPSKVKDKVANVELTNEWEKDTTTGLWTLKIENISPDVGEIETYTYTYTVNQADAGNNLTNTAAMTGDELDPKNPPEDKDEHEVTNDGDITLQPADITIYMGGEDGYAGAAGGDSKSLPEPGFYITLPADVENALKTELGLENGAAADLSDFITGVTATTKDGQTRSWTMQMYGESASTAWINNQKHFVYSIVPGENQPAISVNFTNEDGTPVTEDKFTLTDSLFETYKMSLNTADVDVETISLTFNINGKIFHCGYDAQESAKTPGTLTVRYTTTPDAPSTKAVTDLAAEVQKDPEQFYVQVENDQKFYINEKSANEDGVDVTAKDVSLLVDSLVGGEDYTYTSALYSKAVTAAGFESSGVWGQYLDLVDADNGNAWLTPEGEVTVFWPYPAGVTKDTGTIKLYHFEGLDRDMATDDVMAEINKTEADEVPITRLDDGFTFKTSSFSPFVLVQDTTQPSGGEDKPTGGDDGNNDNNNNNTNNNTNTNNQTTTVNVANQAAAPAAAPAAIPQTGDAMPVGLLGGLAAAAAAGFAALFVIRKRKQNG